MPTSAANGVDLYYEEEGAGEALLLVQGLSYATPMWQWQFQGLKDSFRVIAFDNRGSGLSSKPDIPYSVPMFAADAAALLDRLAIQSAHVLGISMGGIIAEELALSFPDRVRRLILCSTIFGGANARQPSSETLGYLMQYQETPSEEICRMEIGYGTAPGFCENHPERAARLVEFKLRTRPPRFAYMRQLMSGVGYSNEDRLRRLKIPTLIMVGRHDRILPPENANRLHTLIPGSQIRIFENSGHHPHIEEPEAFNQAVRDFLMS